MLVDTLLVIMSVLLVELMLLHVLQIQLLQHVCRVIFYLVEHVLQVFAKLMLIYVHQLILLHHVKVVIS